MISSLLLYRVLRSHHHKWRRYLVSMPIDRNLSFFHHFKQCGLCFGGGAVDLIYQNNIAEDGPFVEFKGRFFWVENTGADHIARHHIGRKLYTRKTNGYTPAEQFGRERFGHARHTFDQYMPVGKYGREQ